MADVGKRARSRTHRSGAHHDAFCRPSPHRFALADRLCAGPCHAGPQRGAAGARAVKHLPLFFDVAGRKVVVVGAGPIADRKAATVRSAGADVRQIVTAEAADFVGAVAAFIATGRKRAIAPLMLPPKLRACPSTWPTVPRSAIS